MDAVSAEIDADNLYAIKIATDSFEVNIRLPPSDAMRLATVSATRWDDGAVRIGESAGAPVHWCSSEAGGVSILIGHDDQTWDVGLEISKSTFDTLLAELATLSPDAGLTRR